MDGSPFITGMGLGFTVAAPIGPIAALCIQRTLSSGPTAGVATGLGASTVHTMFGALAIFGISSLAHLLERNASVFLLGSATLLVWMSLRFYTQPQPTHLDVVIDRRSLGAIYVSTLAFGLANPLTMLLFIGYSPMLGPATSGNAAAFLSGVFSGSIIWWIVLTILVAQLRGPSIRYLAAWTGKIAALTLIAIAGSLVMRAIRIA